MNARELAQRMNKMIAVKVEGNEEEWLSIDKELIRFNKTATLEEIALLHKECPKGEVFCIIASSLEYERKKIGTTSFE